MPDLTPLGVRREGGSLLFFLRSNEEILEQLPTDYEVLLGSRLAAILADESAKSVCIDLEDIPGITSRQLGALIALGRVLRSRFGVVPMQRVNANVLHLLQLTKTDSLFKLG
jgi:ABC-type transporter Mla MlaB component